MKIKRIKILSSFRSLPENFEIKFDEESSSKSNEICPICFVGLNGTGKSNVIEVIAEIFFYLENFSKAQKQNIDKFNTSFGFEIDYELPLDYLISIPINRENLHSFLEKSDENPIIRVNKQLRQLPIVTVQNSKTQRSYTVKDLHVYTGILPARIIAYSSGMNELLSNPFIKIDFKYYEELISRKHYIVDSSLDVNRMFFLNYDSNKLITICNFMFDADFFDMSSFREIKKATEIGGIDLEAIKRALSIKKIHSFRIKLKLKKTNDDDAYQMHTTLNLALEKLKKCATFVNEVITRSKNIDNVDLELVFWVNNATREAFKYNFITAYELYKIFYFFQLLNAELISKKTRLAISSASSGSYENLSDELPKNEADKLKFNVSGITFLDNKYCKLQYRKLSDGEHQLLQVIGSILILDTPATLFLYDEPDTHLNPEWRSKFVQLLNQSVKNERSQEIILTTHSPYIVSDCKRENVYIFQRNSVGSVSQPVGPSINTFGTSISILSDIVFGKRDTISELSKKKIQEILDMPLNSIKEIQEAKEASRALGESVEKVLLFKELISRENELQK